MIYKKGFAGIYILIGIVILAALGGGSYFLAGKSIQSPFKSTPKACTEEAKQCPDGSYVGREGPNCEFKTCSTPQRFSFPEGQEVTIKGTVIKNHTKGLELDALGWVEIQTDQGSINVKYHPGDDECLNNSARNIGFKLQSGDEVEVFGKYSQGYLETCKRLEYYLKKIDQKDKIVEFLDQGLAKVDSKACLQDSDCTLLQCSGCFNSEWVKTAPPDLACMQYEGYKCECRDNRCKEAK